MATQIDPAFKSAWRESQGQPVDSEVLNRRAAAPQEPAPEPVAWREKDFASGRYVYGSPKEVRAAHGVGAIVEPLYASAQPANPAQVTGAMVDAAKEAVWNTDAPEYMRDYLQYDNIIRASLTAAIGAGGQAVGEEDALETIERELIDGLEVEISIGAENYTFNHRQLARRILSALSQPHPADERVVEALATVEEWQKWALTWAGSAFLSGETISPDDMTETEYKSELYSGMCKLSNHMTWLRDEIAALSKQEPVVGGAHTDDLAVDRFAIAMKAKLAKKRADGRGGWDNRDECTAEHLSYMLVQHTIKGDPLDVGNLAMMLHQRGDRIVIDDETRSIAAALGKESGWRPTHRHVRRGSEYEIIGQAQVQCSDGLTDYEVATVYRGKDGQLWVRRKSEFEDGRFEAIATAPKQGAK